MNINAIFQFISDLFFIKESDTSFENSEEEMLKKAHQELLCAENLFARVEDPAMIDYAIYSMKAAEEHYNYLFRLIKEQKNNDNKAITGNHEGVLLN